MTGKRWVIIIILVSLSGLLPGCTLLETAVERASTDPYEQLSAKYAETKQAQAAALALWDRIIFGEVVSCQEAIPIPAPLNLTESELQNYPAARSIQEQLNAAIKGVADSANLWNIECNEDRPFVPLNWAREGRTSALAATDPLAEVERLLRNWVAG